MDPMTAIGLVTSAVELLVKVEPIAVQGFENLKGYAVALYEKYTGQTITDEQRKELEDNIDTMHSQFQAPIPPADEQ